jgi:hypothetical protein
MSGKAIHETAPPAGTAIWEKLKALEESERHTFVRPLLLLREEAFLAPKRTPELFFRSLRNQSQ